jgi:peptide/nickel transport system substrate-binding protein
MSRPSSSMLVDRRTMLKGSAAGLVLAALSGVSAARAAGGSKKGGHFRLGMAGGNTSDSLDPATYSDSVMFLTGYTIRNNLTELVGKEIVGSLAQNWDVSDGAKKWVFNLRPGVTFHSGKTLTPDDVIATLNYHRGETSKSSAKPLVSSIADIVADGPSKVVVNLKSGNSDFAALMCDTHLMILPSVDGKVDPTSRDGTGGYILDDFRPGERSTFKRNPNYWKGDKAAFFDTAEVLSVSDVAARMNALMGGDVDAINRVDVKTVGMLKRRKGLKVEEITGYMHNVFCMRTDTAPFTDNNVRMALKHAVRRQELVDKILGGHGSIANDQPISPNNKYFAKDIPQRDYDPDKSRYYLKQAGLSELKVPLSVANAGFAGAVDAGVLYSDSAKAAGITIDVVREADDGYFDKVWMKRPWSVDYWGGRITEDWMFSNAYAADAPYNETYWKNPRFNELLIAARSETDEAKRAPMYREMQLLVRDDGGAVIPMYANHVWAVKDGVAHGDDLAANWEMDGLRCIERWWFAA